MVRVFSLLSLAPLVAALSAWTEEEKNRPVSKVIVLLKDMQKQLEKEHEQDQEIYDKLACWCKTNDREKNQQILDAESHIAMLQARIEENTAKAAQLKTEIENLQKEVAKNQQALDQATKLRREQLAEFTKEEKDLLQSIQALKNAVIVLSKHHSPPAEELVTIKNMLKHQFEKHSDLLDTVVAPSQKDVLDSVFLQQAPHLQAYAPASGEIFGILKNMRDTFQENLSTSQQEEQANQKAYEGLKAAKLEEIKAGQYQVDEKTDTMAKAVEQVANDKQDMNDTMNSLGADEKFLLMLKEKCAQTDAEWNERQKTRQDEIGAVSAALKFLSSDDAHDLFTKTFNSFVQVGAVSNVGEESRKQRAVELLQKKAVALNKPELAAIANSVKLDAFVKVKKAIDDMVTELLKQKADESKHRDYCVDSLNKNQKENAKATRDQADLNAKKEELEATIDTLKGEIKGLHDEIAEAQVQIKRAGEDRELQNKEFQETVADQQATIRLLGQAVNVLKSFYERRSVLLQQDPLVGTATVGDAESQFAYTDEDGRRPPPPGGFDTYQKNEASGGVVAMITQIIHDAKMMLQEATHDENDAQSSYETFTKETNRGIQEKNVSIVNKDQEKGRAEMDLSETHSSLDGKKIELEQLSNENADLHKSCDFVMKNFEVRQEAFDQEVEALRQAKSILSGADFRKAVAGFLQKRD
jgi:uncharacterized protein YejL (UPF0352 family)